MNNSIKKPLLCASALFLSTICGQAAAFYVSSPGTGTIDRVTSTGVVSTWVSGVTNTYNLAMDSNGALYTEYINGTILKFSSPATSTVSTTFTLGTQQSLAIAVDASGNVFQANLSAGNIVEYNAAGTKVFSFTASGLMSPRSITLDASGNIYAANYSAKTVTKYDVSGALLATYTTTGTALEGIALDNSGNIFTSAGNVIYEINTSGVVSTFATLPGTNLLGLAYSGGDLYVIDNAHLSLLKVDGAGVATTFATGLDSGSQWLTTEAVPEPTSWALFVLSGAGFLGVARRKRVRENF